MSFPYSAPSQGTQLSLFDLEFTFPLDRFVQPGVDYLFTTGQVGNRRIYIPNEPMRELQREFAKFLFDLNFDMRFCHGGIPDRSTRTNAAAHAGNNYFVLMDIRAAYQSQPLARTAEIIWQKSPQLYRWPPEITSAWLQAWCFLPQGGVITGAASAPLLFNIYTAVEFDQRIGKWLREEGLTYSRYMDDLTFSSQRPITKYQRRHIRYVLAEAGFEVAPHKTRVNLDIYKGPIEITGVMLDKTGRTSVSKKRRRRANGMLAAALAGKVNPPVAHGHMSECLAAISGNREERFRDPSVRALRQAQLRLLWERPMN